MSEVRKWLEADRTARSTLIKPSAFFSRALAGIAPALLLPPQLTAAKLRGADQCLAVPLIRLTLHY
jgi:hypothetical protein